MSKSINMNKPILTFNLSRGEWCLDLEIMRQMLNKGLGASGLAMGKKTLSEGFKLAKKQLDKK